MAHQERKWFIVCDVEGKNPGKETKTDSGTGANEGGIVVKLSPGDNSPLREVGRVAFDRTRATAKSDQKVSFKVALKKALDVANDAAMLINEQEQMIARLLGDKDKVL